MKRNIKTGYVNVDLTKMLTDADMTSLAVGSTSTTFTLSPDALSYYQKVLTEASKAKKPAWINIPEFNLNDGTHTLSFTSDYGNIVMPGSISVENGTARLTLYTAFIRYDGITRFMRAITINLTSGATGIQSPTGY